MQGQLSDKIVCFGDSTTAPRLGVDIYMDQLCRRFKLGDARVEFLNKGVPGNDTRMAMVRFDEDILSTGSNIVVIQFGINDSTVDVWKECKNSHPRVPLIEYRDNLRFFIRRIRDQGAIPILMTPNQLRWTNKLRSLYGKPPYDPTSEHGFSKVIAAYADCVRDLSADRGIPLVDVFTLYSNWESQAGRSCETLLSDGMHPNTMGHKIVADALTPIIDGMLVSGTPSASWRGSMHWSRSPRLRHLFILCSAEC